MKICTCKQYFRSPRISDGFIILILIIPSSVYVTFSISYYHGNLKNSISPRIGRADWSTSNVSNQRTDQRLMNSDILPQNGSDTSYAQESSPGLRQRSRPNNVEVTPKLILFTTFPVNTTNPYRLLAQRTTIRNWAQLRPFLQPVLFTDEPNSELAGMASKANWHILAQTTVNKYGTPSLKPMVNEILKRYPNVSYYGFANGDIQFDESLIRTLNRINDVSEHLQNNILLVGVRNNLDMNITAPESTYNISNFPYLSRLSKPFKAFAEDYFIFSRAGNKFNWSAIKDVVIGRPAYDNYLVAEAIRMGVNVIDATRTLFALHMSNPKSNYEGFNTKDANYNRKVIGRYMYSKGRLNAAKLATAYNLFGVEVVVRR